MLLGMHRGMVAKKQSLPATQLDSPESTRLDSLESTQLDRVASLPATQLDTPDTASQREIKDAAAEDAAVAEEALPAVSGRVEREMEFLHQMAWHNRIHPRFTKLKTCPICRWVKRTVKHLAIDHAKTPMCDFVQPKGLPTAGCTLCAARAGLGLPMRGPV